MLRTVAVHLPSLIHIFCGVWTSASCYVIGFFFTVSQLINKWRISPSISSCFSDNWLLILMRFRNIPIKKYLNPTKSDTFFKLSTVGKDVTQLTKKSWGCLNSLPGFSPFDLRPGMIGVWSRKHGLWSFCDVRGMKILQDKSGIRKNKNLFIISFIEIKSGPAIYHALNVT